MAYLYYIEEFKKKRVIKKYFQDKNSAIAYMLANNIYGITPLQHRIYTESSNYNKLFYVSCTYNVGTNRYHWSFKGSWKKDKPRILSIKEQNNLIYFSNFYKCETEDAQEFINCCKRKVKLEILRLIGV